MSVRSFDSPVGTRSTSGLGTRAVPQISKPTLKLPFLLSPRVQRIAVVGPTVMLSMWLSSLDFPLLPRVTVSIAVGIALILLVARHQRRARMS
jgi:hypothetical protein